MRKWEAAYILVDRFLIALADGWRFTDDIAEPIQAHHGVYSCIMWRAL